MKSYADVFIDPITGKMSSGGGSGTYSLAKFIVQTACPDLPNAQALDELKDGMMFKIKNGRIVTHQRLIIDELPPLGGAWVKGLFRGNIWRGGKNGLPEESDALSNAIVDLGLLNTKLIVANFVMGSSLVPQVWQGATFLDKMRPGLMYNCAQLPDKIEKGCIRRAIPNKDYMQPDLRQHQIWMGYTPDIYEEDPDTIQIKAPWVEATYITKTPLESSPESQALSQLEIGINDLGLIRVDSEGEIYKATLEHNMVWCGNEEGSPEPRNIDFPDNEAKYILQEPNETLKNAQALNQLDISDKSLIFVTEEGEIKPAKLRSNSIWCGNSEDKPAERRLDFITKPKYILQSKAEFLDNAQALDELAILSNGILKVNDSGVISEARAGEDYATTEQLDEAVERAETAATEAEASAEEATVAAGEATTAATEATGAAGEASVSAGASAASAAAALLSATGAGISAGSASSSASSASSSEDNAKWYSNHAEEEYNKITSTEIKLVGDVIGQGKPNEEISTKIKDNPVFGGNVVTLAGGLISDRPANPTKGMFRYLSNEESPVVKLEFYNGEEWKEIV